MIISFDEVVGGVDTCPSAPPNWSRHSEPFYYGDDYDTTRGRIYYSYRSVRRDNDRPSTSSSLTHTYSCWTDRGNGYDADADADDDDDGAAASMPSDVIGRERTPLKSGSSVSHISRPSGPVGRPGVNPDVSRGIECHRAGVIYYNRECLLQ